MHACRRCPWGHGKTTFLKIWTAHLRKQHFPVVEFNAWETDYSGNPFATLSSELTESLQQSADKSLALTIQHFKRQAARVARRAAPTIAQGIGTAFPIVGRSLGQVAATLLKDNVSAHEENQKLARVGFKKLLIALLQRFVRFVRVCQASGTQTWGQSGDNIGSAVPGIMGLSHFTSMT